jgi:hypothetical protein
MTQEYLITKFDDGHYGVFVLSDDPDSDASKSFPSQAEAEAWVKNQEGWSDEEDRVLIENDVKRVANE